MIDYTILYRDELPLDTSWDDQPWDVFISAYNSSQRVEKVFNSAVAINKYWLIQPDYNYNVTEYPNSGKLIIPKTSNEADCAEAIISKIGVDRLKSSKICIDVTGFIKPYMMALLRWLLHNGCMKYDIIYSEPMTYADNENTKFSDGSSYNVRHVHGMGGVHINDTSNDLLVIGSGYEDDLISYIAENKNNTKKIHVIGFPSLRPDMYQENILNVQKASESFKGEFRDSKNVVFAPANDPFVTATVLSELVEDAEKNFQMTNLYLSPLATKPQALGFTLFYLKECLDRPVSMIYPFCSSHSKATSKGISRIWKYTIELDF
jgi:hypothetical protein